ncbi:Nucleolar protein 12, partial [Teratosphaeriaceae sp. CCFEE 6253]
MAEKMKKTSSTKAGDGVDKKAKKDSSKTIDKSAKRQKSEAAAQNLALLAKDKLDPTLSSLFAVKPAAIVPRADTPEDEDEDEELSEPESDAVEAAFRDEEVASDALHAAPKVELPEETEPIDVPDRKRKRKHRDADEDLEAAYLDRLARDDERDAAKRRKGDHPIPVDAEAQDEVSLPNAPAHTDASDDEMVSDDDITSPPPQHESQQSGTAADADVQKANRTVFLGNVATLAITSKPARKTLLAHLASFFPDLPAPPTKPTDDPSSPKPSIESLRFRSTPYAPTLPKKAAFARKQVMDTTTKSTNAYAVYSSPHLAREAAKRLNGTTVLDRHLRVDEVAHPAPIDAKRCVFVGNLGFVGDESAIQRANDEDAGRGEVRKRGKEPSDVEEGLWRVFSRCGVVES